MTRTRMILAAALLATLTLGGCGKSSSVSGTVSYDGVPIDNGSITFVPDGGGDAHKVPAAIQEGKYTIGAGRAPAPGKYKVEITWNKAAPGKTAKDPDLQGGNPRQALPERYNKATTLTAEIKSGPNTIDFPLTSR